MTRRPTPRAQPSWRYPHDSKASLNLEDAPGGWAHVLSPRWQMTARAMANKGGDLVRGSIIVGTDGSESSAFALREAGKLARRSDCGLVLAFIRRLGLAGGLAGAFVGGATASDGLALPFDWLDARVILAFGQGVATLDPIGVTWSFEVHVGQPAKEPMKAAISHDSDTIVVAQPSDAALGALIHRRVAAQLTRRWRHRLLVVHPEERYARTAFESNSADTWVYRFDDRSTSFGGRLGAEHAVKIPYVFNNPDDESGRALNGDAPPQTVASTVHDAWVRFIADGHPGWPRYILVHRSAALIDEEIIVVDDPDSAEREVWAGSDRAGQETLS
jgi:nucleotide-binding universal stress UspA family protein